MTVQMKRFIELSDIIGLRFECKTCGCSLSLSNKEEKDVVDDIISTGATFTKCPTCSAKWTEWDRYTGGDSEIKSMFRAIREVKRLEKSFGCSVKLEITGVDKP